MLLSTDLHHLADALSTAPVHQRIRMGENLVEAARQAAAQINAHNAGKVWPDGRPVAEQDWTQHLGSAALKAKHRWEAANPGRIAFADVMTRDGLNAWEAAVIVLTNVQREEERRAA